MQLILLSVLAGAATCAYVDYTTGTMNLIISAPHGGHSHPSDIPKRTIDLGLSSPRRGCYNATTDSCTYDHANDLPHNCPDDDQSECIVKYLKDSYTKEIANLVSNELYSLTGKRPYMVINNIRREYLDANREINLATFNDAEAVTAYNDYMSYLQQAVDAISQNQNMAYGLLLDFHGQVHSADWTEIGYTLSKSKLNDHENNNLVLDPDDTTIRALVNRRCGTNNTCFMEILYGADSLGNFLISEPRYDPSTTYRAVPSPDDKSPGNEGYFSGGYITKEYGSKDVNNNNVDSLQIEMPGDARKVSNERNNFAPALARSIKSFLDANYPGAY